MLPYQTLAIHRKPLLDMETYKKSYKSNKLKLSAPTWNDKFELPDGSYSVSDIQDYFQYTFKNHKAVTDNSSIII